MRPKSNTNSPGCTNPVSSTCVTWEGGNIPELGICTGMSLTDTEWKIATKLVELSNSLDFSDFDLSCLVNSPSADPTTKDIQLIVQLLYDNQCTLKQLIDNTSGTANVEVNLNMRCLRLEDDFGNEITQNLNQTLQRIINKICADSDRIDSLTATTQDLQEQIDNIPTIDPYEEPSISTCVTQTPRKVSEVLPLVAQDLCNYKDKVGAVIDVQQSLARQCADLNTLLGTTDGWILNPQSLAQSINNLWLTTCNLLARVTLIENNCCKVTCKDILLGFDVVTNEDQDAISLKFTSKAGTDIPIGFVDCGSTVTITDIDNNDVVYPLEISNGATLGEFNISGLNLTGVLNISVMARLCADGLSCEKCVGKVYKISGGACPVCAITNTGTTPVHIIYKTN